MKLLICYLKEEEKLQVKRGGIKTWRQQNAQMFLIIKGWSRKRIIKKETKKGRRRVT